MIKTIAVLILATLAAAVGEALLARGMKQVGDVSAIGLQEWWRAFAFVKNPLVLLGVAFTTAFFVLFMFALSWSDLSYAQPLTALSFVFGTLLAKYYLGEDVSVWRWVGVLVIVLGVILVTRDPRHLTSSG